MAVFVACLVLFLAMAGRSSALYCLCKDGLPDTQYQTNIDYACGAGADCSAILQNGPCFSPNTVKDHCNYAVNSYFQRKQEVNGSCDFKGTATTSQTPPTTAVSGCVYPSSSSTSTTPSTNPTTSPTGTGTGTNPITTPTGSTTGTGFGISPSGSGITNPDGSSGAMTFPQHSYFLVTLLIWGLLWLKF